MAPTIDIVDGIRILFYNCEHRPPHFHAIYNEYEVIVDIQKTTVIAGQMPKKALKKVYIWLAENKGWAVDILFELNPELR